MMAPGAAMRVACAMNHCPDAFHPESVFQVPPLQDVVGHAARLGSRRRTGGIRLDNHKPEVESIH